MARRLSTEAVLLQVSVLILTLTLTVDGFTLGLKQLAENYVRATHFCAKSYNTYICLILH